MNLPRANVLKPNDLAVSNKPSTWGTSKGTARGVRRLGDGRGHHQADRGFPDGQGRR